MSDAEEPELRLANNNPWYCLATLYGELPKGTNWDEDLVSKNRMAWNRWIAGVLSDEQREGLVGKGFPEPELVPLPSTEKSAFCSAFASRTGREEEAPPDPAGVVDFAHTRFDVKVVFDGFLFAWAGAEGQIGAAMPRPDLFGGEAIWVEGGRLVPELVVAMQAPGRDIDRRAA